MKYSQVASPYLKSMISQTSWDNHVLIDDLIKLEEYLRKGWPSTYIGSLHYASLKYNHHNHYLNLLKEIDIEKYNQVMIDMEREKKISEENSVKISKESEENRNDWVIAGGK